MGSHAVSGADSLTSRTTRGMAWSYGSYVAGRVLVLLATAILARLLTPVDFGVVALALTFMAFLDMFCDLGMAESLMIVDDRDLESKAETAVTLVIIVGVVLFAASWALGPVAAEFYDEDELRWLVPALGATILLRALGTGHYVIAQKRMDFRTRTIAELVEVVARGVAGIGLALAGAGVWSLVVGYIAGTAAMTVSLWILVRWRLRLRLRREHLRELLGFGAALTGVGVVAALTLTIDKLLIGRTLGPEPLGLYSLATRLPELLLINLTIVAGQVLFAAFAAVDSAALGRAFLTTLRYALILVLPVAAFLGVLAEPLIVTAFGDQWGSAAPVMQLFTVTALLSPITIVCGTVWKATGQGRTLLRLALLQLVTLVPAVVIFVSDGIIAVAACQAGSTMVVAAVSLCLVTRRLGLHPSVLAGVFAAPLVAATTMAVVLLAVDAVVAGRLSVLAVGAVVGAAVYGAVLWLVAPAAVRELVGVLRPTLRETPPPEPAPEGGVPAPMAIDTAQPGGHDGAVVVPDGPLFTVFTATYERAHLLHRVHESLGAQTLRDFEWLIVDDGSDDGTAELVAGWAARSDFRIRYVWQPNQGKHVAFNRGVQEAAGELFLSLDSDDACVPTALERFRHHWEAIPEQERASFSAVSCLCSTKSGEIIGSRFRHDLLDSDPREIRYVHKAKGEKWGFHRTKVLREYPFPTGDWPFVSESLVWDRIGRRYRTRYVNEALRIYHTDEGEPSLMIEARNAPRLSEMFLPVFREQLNEDLRYVVRAPVQFGRSAVNYVRHSLHQRVGPVGQLAGLRPAAWPLWAIGVPLGIALYLRDRHRFR